jgi:cytochrome c553
VGYHARPGWYSNRMRVSNFIKIFLLLVCLFGFCKQALAQDESLIIAGKTKAITCAACHGADGNTPPNPVWPKLGGQSAEYLSKELLDFQLAAKGGRNNPVMVALVAGLSKTDIAELAAYYASVPLTIGAAKPELVNMGQQLYRGGDLSKGIPACAACHAPDGLGNAPAAFPVLSGQNADYISEQLKAFRAGTRANDLNHMMRDIAAKMSDSEITAVASYISGLH